MTPTAALVTTLVLVLVAVGAGTLLRATSGRRRRPGVGGVRSSELAPEGLGDAATIVQFSTEFCARCPGVRRALTALADESEDVAFAEIDLTHRRELAERYRVLQTPTVLVLDAVGDPVARYAGGVTIPPVRAEIDGLRTSSV